MPFDRREIGDAARGIHLPNVTIANLRDQPRAILVLPLLERPRRRNLEAIEEGTVDAHVSGYQMVGVDVNPTRRQANRGALNHDRLAGDLRFDYRETLCEGVISKTRGRLRPQQVGEVVARELLAGFQRETNEEGEKIGRASCRERV